MLRLGADTEMRRIAAVVYADEAQATRAAEEVERRASELGLDLDAFATVIWEQGGACLLTTSRQPSAAARWNGFWGTAFEAISNQEAVGGLDPALRDRIRAALHPGSSALLMAIEPALRDSLLRALRPYGGETFGCDDTGR